MNQPNNYVQEGPLSIKSSASLVRSVSWSQTSISYVNSSIKLNFNQSANFNVKPLKRCVFWIYVMLFPSSDTFRKEFVPSLTSIFITKGLAPTETRRDVTLHADFTQSYSECTLFTTRKDTHFIERIQIRCAAQRCTSRRLAAQREVSRRSDDARRARASLMVRFQDAPCDAARRLAAALYAAQNQSRVVSRSELTLIRSRE
jgi:hypothetical protein